MAKKVTMMDKLELKKADLRNIGKEKEVNESCLTQTRI